MARETHERPVLFQVIGLLIGGLLLTSVLGCQRSHKYTPSSLNDAAERFAFPAKSPNEIELILDTSASMRGFALAAVRDDASTTNSWQSLFVGLDALPHRFLATSGSQADANSPKAPVSKSKISPPSPVGSERMRFTRFGGSIEPFADTISLLPTMLGMQSVSPLGQRGLTAVWKSRSCSQGLAGGERIRDAIDNLFSEGETCLGLAFDRATESTGGRSFSIVLTDSEQASSEDSVGCPMGNNPAPIQDRLYDWVHTRGLYAAIVVFRLPYEGWKVSAPTRNYCGCENRNLFAYLLGPSADAVEEAYLQIRAHWTGAAAEIAYLPLAPRPAAQYTVKMTIAKTKDGDVPVSIESGQQRLEPESGHLPTFNFRLEKGSAVVNFDVSQVALVGVGTRENATGSAQNTSQEAMEWRDRPSLLEAPAATKGAKSGALLSSHGEGAFEFIRLPLPKEASNGVHLAFTRNAQFLSKAQKVAEGELSKVRMTGSWEVRKRQGIRHACEIYLFELYARGDEFVGRLIADTPLLQRQDRVCSNLDSIEAQVRHVYKETPVVRFLLHIDA